MKALTKILQISAEEHGLDTPLTIGHLLNICKLAEKADRMYRQYKAQKEEKQHHEIMNEISYLGQD